MIYKFPGVGEHICHTVFITLMTTIDMKIENYIFL